MGFGGLEDEESDSEQVLGDQGCPTRMERKSFRLNVENGDTESIDEDWDRVRRLNGIFDGTNNRREVEEFDFILSNTDGSYDAIESGGDCSFQSSVSGIGYQVSS